MHFYGKWQQTSKQGYTQRHVQSSFTSVGLTKAHPLISYKKSVKAAMAAAATTVPAPLLRLTPLISYSYYKLPCNHMY